MDDLFNILFLGIFGGFFAARLGYIVLHLDWKYLNPLVFFDIFNHSGMSLAGGILGGFLTVSFFTRSKRIHPGRFLDYTGIALLASIPVGYLGNYLTSGAKDWVEGILIIITYVISFFFFTRILYPKFMRGNLKEGSSSLLFLILFSLISLFRDIVMLYKDEVLLHSEDFLYIAVFFLAAMVLIRHETKRSTKT